MHRRFRHRAPLGLIAAVLACGSCLACSLADPPAGAKLADAAQEGGQASSPASESTDRGQRDSVPAEPEAAEAETEIETEPLSREDYSAYLEGAHQLLRNAGVHKSPAFRSHGRLPDQVLKDAYNEGRAQAFRGRPVQVEQWMGIAKFGGEYDPSGKPRPPSTNLNAGPLAAYDLTVVVVSADKAYLHVVVPVDGPGKQSGTHRAYLRDQWWSCLGDTLVPGRDFFLFKSNNKASLHRQWAQDWVIAHVAELAKAYKLETGAPIGIGDLSLVVGGKISDHWTHRLGVDADMYLLRFDDPNTPGVDTLKHSWHSWKRSASVWSGDPEGRRDREEVIEGSTASAKLLLALAEAALEQDDLHFFVHNAVDILTPFDKKAQERRSGRRYLHAKNRAFWPEHRDHVHLRWTARRRLPVDVPPRP